MTKSKPAPRPTQKPQDIGPCDWYYEHRGRIELIHRVTRSDGSLIQTDHIHIPWRKLLKSAERCRPESMAVRPLTKKERGQ